jgi:arylsulfatase
VYLIHSDHGEAFGEHGTFGHDPYTYEENIHVPYIIANGVETGTRTTQTSLRFIPDHISYHAGLLNQTTYNLGRNNTVTLSNPFGVRSAIRTRNLKYIWEAGSKAHTEVYALSQDSDEMRDIANERPQLKESLRELATHRMQDEREKLEISNAISDISRDTKL